MASISTEAVARVEHLLDHSEICSLIFLLYDNEHTALQQMQTEIMSTRRYAQVSDSSLFKPAEVSYEGVLVQWVRANRNKDHHWQDKFLESLLLIKNYQIIRVLGESKSKLDDKYLPRQVHTAYRVDLARKVLYFIMEALTNQQWKKVQADLTEHEKDKLKSISSDCSKIREYFITYLMCNDILKTKAKNGILNFSRLRSALENAKLSEWSDNLKNVEDYINGTGIDQKEKNPSGMSETHKLISELPSFNLDPKNQGTVLIFNMDDYSSTEFGNRIGSKVDCDRLKDTFKLLNFEYEIFNNTSSAKILGIISEYLREFCKTAREQKVERCFVVALLAHGNKEGIVGSDGKVILWTDISQELRYVDTDGLPRLLITQACKGDKQATKIYEMVKDGPSSSKNIQNSNLKDLYEISSSVEGFAAFRSETHGSFFIRSLCKHLLLLGKRAHVQELANYINIDYNRYKISCEGLPVDLTSDVKASPTKKLYIELPEKNKKKAEKMVEEWEEVLRRKELEHKRNEKCHTDENISKVVPQLSREELIYQEILKKLQEDVDL